MDAQLRLIPRTKGGSGKGDTGATTHDSTDDRTTARGTTRRAGRTATPRSARTADPAEAPAQWRIDDEARERGRAGISRARQALQAARPPRLHDRHTTAA